MGTVAQVQFTRQRPLLKEQFSFCSVTSNACIICACCSMLCNCAKGLHFSAFIYVVSVFHVSLKRQFREMALHHCRSAK